MQWVWGTQRREGNCLLHAGPCGCLYNHLKVGPPPFAWTPDDPAENVVIYSGIAALVFTINVGLEVDLTAKVLQKGLLQFMLFLSLLPQYDHQ